MTLQNFNYNYYFSEFIKSHSYLRTKHFMTEVAENIKKEIDRIFDRQSVKDKYVFNKMDLQAIKSYCKNDSAIIKLLVRACHSKKECDSIFSPFFYSNDNIFTFRNREYITRDLVKLFLIEYIDDLISGDKTYCDMEEI